MIFIDPLSKLYGAAFVPRAGGAALGLARMEVRTMHVSASIQGRWLSLVVRDDRLVTRRQWTVLAGRMWTSGLAWSTLKVDVAFARVAGR